MTVYSIGFLTLQSRTQNKSEWLDRDSGLLVYDSDLSALQLAQPTLSDLLEKALAKADIRLRADQPSELREAGVDVFQGWQAAFESDDPVATLCPQVFYILNCEFQLALQGVLGQQVTVISEAIPRQWRLELAWRDRLKRQPDLLWKFDFHAAYTGELVQGLK